MTQIITSSLARQRMLTDRPTIPVSLQIEAVDPIETSVRSCERALHPIRPIMVLITIWSLYRDGLRAGRPGFDSRHGKIVFLFSTASRPTLGFTQPSMQWVLGIKRPGCEAELSPPSSVEVKNGGAVPPLLPHS
jgi:hypothetical protein